MNLFLQNSIDGLLIGAAYGIAGIGFAFVYIVIRRLDLAYGSCLMAALYAVVAIAGSRQISLVASLALALPIAVAVLAYSQWLCFPASLSPPPITVVAASFALWMQIEEVVTLFMPLHHYAFPTDVVTKDILIGSIAIRSDLIVIGLLSVLTALALYAFIHLTRDGRALRAAAQCRVAAALCGISPTRLWLSTLLTSATLGTIAALSMVTIAALIAAPGLGGVVLQALQSLNVGNAFVAGLAIVIMAIVLDRVTTAASRRAEISARLSKAKPGRRRLLALGAGLVVTLFAVFLSRSVLWAAQFPSSIDIGGGLSDVVSNVSDWTQSTLSLFTTSLKDVFTIAVLNPFQALLTESPALLVALVILAVAVIVGGVRAAIVSAVCLVLIASVGLWEDSMITLASTLIATVVTMVLGLVVGVAMGRSASVDGWLRPILDAAQTMPAFVYLIPFLGLFGPSRFTAIVAAIIYAAPVSIKIIAEGIAAVSKESVEAAQSSGSSPWQTITKVQLPMARSSIALATNQGLIYVLAMVVVGGLVGGGALGYDVVAGFSQISLFGKGLAAGIAIVLLGIMLDRITQGAGGRPSTGAARAG